VVDAQGFAQLATGAEARRVLAMLERLSAEFGTTFEIEGDRARLPLH